MARGGSTSVNETLDPAQGPSREPLCRVCGMIKDARARLIYCVWCKRPNHRTCVNISGDQAKLITRFACPECRNDSPPTPVLGISASQTTQDFDLLQHLQHCKANLSVISKIPKGARITAANALIDLINNAIEFNTPLGWSKLLCFTYHGLQTPPKEKPNSKGPSLVTKIKNQISVFVNSDFPPDGFPFQLRNGRAKPKSKEEILRNRVDAKFADFDFKGAIRELSSEESIAPDNAETFEQLKAKHPAAPDGMSIPPAPEGGEGHVPISAVAVKKAILSFPAGSAGGPDGLRSDHLKNLIGVPGAGNRLLESTTKLVNFVLREKIPEVIRPIFLGQICLL